IAAEQFLTANRITAQGITTMFGRLRSNKRMAFEHVLHRRWTYLRSEPTLDALYWPRIINRFIVSRLSTCCNERLPHTFQERQTMVWIVCSSLGSDVDWVPVRGMARRLGEVGRR